MQSLRKEDKFFEILENVFVGAKVEGKGGFISLMGIKSNYYRQIKAELDKNISEALDGHMEFKEELFDKLYSFFSRYFTENGSIYFNKTPFHNNVYERVYSDNEDVLLFWKTQMLYYVKSDKIFRSMNIELDGYNFYFDAMGIENKKANERKDLIFELGDIKASDKAININVSYSQKGRKTSLDEILKNLRQGGLSVSEAVFKKVCSAFAKQAEVDYFINKNAKAFLQEQFKLWSFQYFWEGESRWSASRVEKLQILKDIAFKIIDFIAQFEDELLNIWQKPKFVRDSHYVITLDRIDSKDLQQALFEHDGMGEQMSEWRELGIIDENISSDDIVGNDEKYKYLPIDTRYFADLEADIIALFDDLDENLDGWLIKSENYQALNTVSPKFKGQVQTIYIDPPFNTGKDFEYADKFQDSTWLSLMKDRIEIGASLLKDNGCFWLHLDHNANTFGKELVKTKFFEIKEIIYDTNATKDKGADLFGYKSFGENFPLKHQTIYYCRNENYLFRKLWKPNRSTTNLKIGWLDLIAVENTPNPKKVEHYSFKTERWNKGQFVLDTVQVDEKLFPVGDIWDDIFSFTQSEMRVSESFSFSSSQKPENLLRRVIQSTSNGRDIILDYFLGIGTTCAVAHKLNRKWIGIEAGDHFNNTYISADGEKKLGVMGRMKWTLFGSTKINFESLNRRPHLNTDIGWQGGGFFKYYKFEQYEDALDKCKYSDGDLLNLTTDKPYQDYVFLKDEKMLECLEMDYEKNEVNIDLERLYPDIDIAETLSNLTGKWVKSIKGKEVKFADGSTIDTTKLDYKLIKPLIWW